MNPIFDRDRARYAAQQAHEQASTRLARLQRRERELTERLDQMRPLTAGAQRFHSVSAEDVVAVLARVNHEDRERVD